MTAKMCLGARCTGAILLAIIGCATTACSIYDLGQLGRPDGGVDPRVDADGSSGAGGAGGEAGRGSSGSGGSSTGTSGGSDAGGRSGSGGAGGSSTVATSGMGGGSAGSGMAGQSGSGGTSGGSGSAGAAAGSGPSSATTGAGGVGGGGSGSGGSSGNGGAADAGPRDAGSDANGPPRCATCQQGLVLYWNFDETSGTTASDSSGNRFDGTYTGNSSAPSSSTAIPLVAFTDPRSRSFSRTNRDSVQLLSMPANLKPTNNLTLSVWYRATSTDTNGSELVSGGDQYLLRISSTGVAFAKATGASSFASCDVPAASRLDGQWHHLVGVSTPSSIALYFDGSSLCMQANTSDIAYARGADLWVGRHGLMKLGYDFSGNLDEVRIYSRALSSDEIRSLAAGAK